MKRIQWLMMAAMFGTLTITSCFIDDDNDGFFGCIDGDGPIVSADLSVPAFTGIDLQLPAKVFITQGDDLKVRVEAKGNIIDHIELDVRNGVWEIETDRCARDLGDMRFYITMPVITELKIAGSGEIYSENFLEVDDILLGISGSGELDLGLKADDVDANISGSGSIKLEGTGDNLDLRISGSGDLRAFNLEMNTAMINISGSGDAEVRVLTELDVRISGSGDVFYKGNPASIDANISGSGRVINAN